MKNRHLLFSALVLTLFSFVSCTKEEVLTATDNSQVVAAVSIDLVNELDIKTGVDISDSDLTSKKTGKSVTASCTIITKTSETNSFPKTYTVDFGTGCTANDVLRKGKLTIVLTGYVTSPGTKMTIQRDNYYVNGNKVEGTIEYENTTVNEGTPQWTRNVTEGKYTDSKGDEYTNSGTHTVKQTAGVSTSTLTDNTYEMTQGTHKVSKKNGATITLTVIEALVKNYDCNYVSKGKLQVESTLLKGTIDYGNGDCDNKATYTQNGIAFPFTM